MCHRNIELLVKYVKLSMANFMINFMIIMLIYMINMMIYMMNYFYYD